MNIPIIRLEVQGMKHTLLTALSQHSVEMEASVQQAVENFCTEKNLTAIVNDAVKYEMDMAVREEVRNFFGFGKAGRRAVKEAILEHLKRTYPEEWFEGEKE